jgi:hypothetical protein
MIGKRIRTPGAPHASKYVAAIETAPLSLEPGAGEMTSPANHVPRWAILMVAAFEAIAIGAALLSR